MSNAYQGRIETILMCYEGEGLKNFLSDETTRMRDAVKGVFARHPEVYCDAAYNSAAKYWMSLLRNDSLDGLSIYMRAKDTDLESALRDLVRSIGKPSSHIRPLKGLDRIMDISPKWTTKKAHEILLQIENET